MRKIHKEKRLQWTRQYIKVDFTRLIFTDECRASLDRCDGWARGWVAHERTTPTRLRRQQVGAGWGFGQAYMDIIWLAHSRLIKVLNLIQDKFMPYVNGMTRQARNKLIFMHDNAPSHASGMAREFLAENGFSGNRLMVWPPSSPDLNPIENYWSCLLYTSPSPRD